MKQLNWSKIPDFKVRDTIFAELVPGQEKVELDTAELEELFAAAPTKEAEEPADAPKKKLKPVSLTDGKKAQLVNIFMSSHRFRKEDVVEMLLALNPAVMTADMTEQLMNVVPSAEERVKVFDYKKKNFALNRLGEPEHLFLAIGSLPLLEERLFANLMRLTFQTRVDQIKPKVELMRSACRQMRESQLWKRLLEAILAVGNFLNAKSGRGNAIGIRLESLLKVADTKGLDKKTTVLSYIVQMLEKNDAPVLSFAGELGSVPLAARLDLTSLSQEARVLQDLTARLGDALTKVPAELNPKDRILDVLNQSALDLYTTMLQSLKTDLQKATLEWSALARIYGEDEKQVSSGEFFGLIVTFMEQFDATRKSIVQERIREQQNSSQKAAKEAAKKRAEAEQEKAKALMGPNATLDVLEHATSGAETRLGAKEAALLMEAAVKAREVQPTVIRSHAGVPSSAMLADLRKGLKSGSAFADKREERKKSLRGKMPDELLPSWAKGRSGSANPSPEASSPASRRSSATPDVAAILAGVAAKKAQESGSSSPSLGDEKKAGRKASVPIVL